MVCAASVWRDACRESPRAIRKKAAFDGASIKSRSRARALSTKIFSLPKRATRSPRAAPFVWVHRSRGVRTRRACMMIDRKKCLP